MRLFLLIGCLSTTIIALNTVAASELVQNGGFETGDLTGYTLVGKNTYVSDNPQFVHSGAFGLRFGSIGVDAILSQTLATTSGTTYKISFFASSEDSFPNDLSVSFGGVLIADNFDFTTSGFQEFSYTATATANATVLAFGLRQDPAYSGLDDISVTASSVSSVPLPASAPMFGAALLAMGAGGYGLKRKTRA